MKLKSISNKIFINLAKLDHVIYKNNLYQLLFGGEHNFNLLTIIIVDLENGMTQDLEKNNLVVYHHIEV